MARTIRLQSQNDPSIDSLHTQIIIHFGCCCLNAQGLDRLMVGLVVMSGWWRNSSERHEMMDEDGREYGESSAET